jgi:adenosylhomocysteinase
MRGMGAQVAIVEVDPVAAIESVMDGFQVMPSLQAAEWGDVFVTATGNVNVFGEEHFRRMKEGAILANSGHFDDELELGALRRMAGGQVRRIRRDLEEYCLDGNRRVYVLGEGRLVNLAAAEGHPAQVMDMSFANQALGVEYVVKHHQELEPRVYVVPEEIDREVARLKLDSLGIEIDEMTPEQVKYSTSWEQGT